MDLMPDRARAALSTGMVKEGSFLASVHWEVSVALCKGNHAINLERVQRYTRASGHACIFGLLIPSAEVESCLIWEPCCVSLFWCTCNC
jgi:hypothetical protein